MALAITLVIKIVAPRGRYAHFRWAVSSVNMCSVVVDIYCPNRQQVGDEDGMLATRLVDKYPEDQM